MFHVLKQMSCRVLEDQKNSFRNLSCLEVRPETPRMIIQMRIVRNGCTHITNSGKYWHQGMVVPFNQSTSSWLRFCTSKGSSLDFRQSVHFQLVSASSVSHTRFANHENTPSPQQAPPARDCAPARTSWHDVHIKVPCPKTCACDVFQGTTQRN